MRLEALTPSFTGSPLIFIFIWMMLSFCAGAMQHLWHSPRAGVLSHNLISSDQQASMTSQLRGCATVPLCIVPLCTCHCAHATVCACHALHPCNVCMLHMRAVHCIHAMHACCGGNPFPTLSLQLSDNMSHQIKRQCLSHVQAELQADSDMPRALQHC